MSLTSCLMLICVKCVSLKNSSCPRISATNSKQKKKAKRILFVGPYCICNLIINSICFALHNVNRYISLKQVTPETVLCIRSWQWIDIIKSKFVLKPQSHNWRNLTLNTMCTYSIAKSAYLQFYHKQSSTVLLFR